MVGIFFSSLLFFTFLISGFSQNTRDYEKTLKSFFKVTGSEEAYKTVVIQMMGIYRKQYPNVSVDVFNRLEKEMLETSINDLSLMLSPVYSKYYSKEELESLITLYKTPIMQKYISNTPALLKESMAIGQAWGESIGRKVADELAKESK
jgi:hypothetical protein